jgi:hypothetical protein
VAGSGWEREIDSSHLPPATRYPPIFRASGINILDSPVSGEYAMAPCASPFLKSVYFYGLSFQRGRRFLRVAL